jgi:hypothetical protein
VNGRPAGNGSIRRELQEVMSAQGLSERVALKAVARRRRISKSEAYRLWQAEKRSSD